MAAATNMRALIITCAAVALSLINAVTAADYVVGNADGGWGGKTDYKAWAEAQTFAPGDTLTFKYNTYHNVLEVTKQSFDECITTNPITYDTSGTTTVLLTMPGKRYFICGAPGHCLNGMKMEIEVADRPAPTTPTPSPPPPPTPLVPPPAPAPATTVPPLTTPPPVALAPVPAPAPAAAPTGRAGHKKKHTKKRYCGPPGTAPARAPTVTAAEADFPEALVAPVSSTPTPPAPTSGAHSSVLRGKVAAAVLTALVGGFMPLVAL